MLAPGELIDGKYRVQRLLGKGGMGAVFEGFHTLVDRRVAIKVLHPDIAASPEGAARFAREVRAAGRIGNEHILEIYDVGSLPDGSRYMVSEYLDGETLASRLNREGSLAPSVAAEITLQLLTGLAAAHHAGIVHRDLKPENIFLLRQKAGKPDFVKIIDFGISKFQLNDGTPMSMTATGAVLGTPYYLSPEQARGLRDIDARSDLYAVGVILYQTVSGRVPIMAETFNELLFKIALESPPTLAEIMPGFDARFSAITEKAMARERSERFQSATELGDALAAWLGLPPRASAPPPAAALPFAAAQTPAAEVRSARDAATQASDSASATQAAVETQVSASGANERTPTSSNFGRTAQRTPAARSRGPLIVASLLALSAAAIAAWLLRPAPTPTAAPASEVSAEVVQAAPSNAASAAAVAADVVEPVASVAPAAAQHAASPAASAAAVPLVANRAAPAVRAAKKSGPSAAAASKATLKPEEPARATAPAATAKPKAARDFGY